MKRRHFLDYSIKSALMIGTGLCPINIVAAKNLQTGLVLNDSFKHHLISLGHPESPERYYAIKQYFIDQGLLSKTAQIKPLDNVETLLRNNHTEAHIASIKQNDPVAHLNASRATAGVLAAVDQVCSGKLRNAFCASRPPGHHAQNTGREEGFCYYNHVAIAARYAQQKYKLKKILIVDWDYHHGNGTEESFYSDPEVLYFSTHDYYAYPGTGDPDRIGEGAGKGFNINVHLDCGSGDVEFLAAFQKKLLPAVDHFKPDLILISCGFDSRVDDLLGCHKITDQGYMEMTSMVKDLADKYCQGRLVSVLEGGYYLSGIARAAALHVEALMK